MNNAQGLPVTIDTPHWFNRRLANHCASTGTRLVSVDIETTRVQPHQGSTTEVGWFDLSTGVGGVFIPPHDLSRADGEALRVSRYVERIAGQPTRRDLIAPLHQLLGGDGVLTTIIGSNPRFDMDHLEFLFASSGLEPAWSRRPLCVAQGAFWLGIGETENPPGLGEAGAKLGVDISAHHAAGDDALMAAEMFTLMWRERQALVA